MARIEDGDDQNSWEKNPEVKRGYQGTDWWYGFTHWALPLFVSVGRGWGPMGYVNGNWDLLFIHVQFLCVGFKTEFITKWTPEDPTDPTPKLGRRAPRRTRTIQPEQ